MAHGRQRHDLSQTAELLAMMANAAGLKGKRLKRVWTANDFLPKSMRTESNEPVMEGRITDLQIFLPPQARAKLREKA